MFHFSFALLYVTDWWTYQCNNRPTSGMMREWLETTQDNVGSQSFVRCWYCDTIEVIFEKIWVMYFLITSNNLSVLCSTNESKMNQFPEKNAACLEKIENISCFLKQHNNLCSFQNDLHGFFFRILCFSNIVNLYLHLPTQNTLFPKVPKTLNLIPGTKIEA